MNLQRALTAITCMFMKRINLGRFVKVQLSVLNYGTRMIFWILVMI